MPTVLDRQTTVDREAAELRKELTDLQGAIASLSETLARTEHERAGVSAMLDEATDLRAALEHRLVELEGDLRRQRLVSVIRGRLLADVLRARLWRRGDALRRAERVEALLARTRAGS
jgi:septal ring factor EnvC (AmiA/AmiB activator)